MLASFSEIEAFVARLWAGRRVSIQPFAYRFDVDFDVAAGSTDTQRIAANAAFVLTDIAVYNSAGGDVDESTIQLEDSSTNERFFDSPALVRSICSVYQDSNSPVFVLGSLPYPRLIQANSNTILTFYGSASAVGAGVVVLNGVSVYEYSQR